MTIAAPPRCKLVVLLEWISHGGQVCSEGFASSFRIIWKCDWLCCWDAAASAFRGSVHGWCVRCARPPSPNPAVCLHSRLCMIHHCRLVYIAKLTSCPSVDTQTHPLSWLTPSFPACTSGTLTCAREIPAIWRYRRLHLTAATLLTSRKA